MDFYHPINFNLLSILSNNFQMEATYKIKILNNIANRNLDTKSVRINMNML
jgi:hypothetical protein